MNEYEYSMTSTTNEHEQDPRELELCEMLKYWDIITQEMHDSIDMFGYARSTMQNVADEIYDELDDIRDKIEKCRKQYLLRKKKRWSLMAMINE